MPHLFRLGMRLSEGVIRRLAFMSFCIPFDVTMESFLHPQTLIFLLR